MQTKLNIFLTVVITILCCGIYFLNKKIKSVAFVDTAAVFNNFSMTKELQKEFSEIKEKRKSELDSIYSIITSNNSANDTINIGLKKYYLAKRDNYLQEQDRIKSAYDAKIWNQINALIKDFGKENNFDIILGANGQGSVMHGKEELNLSEDFILFANNKYSGK